MAKKKTTGTVGAESVWDDEDNAHIESNTDAMVGAGDSETDVGFDEAEAEAAAEEYAEANDEEGDLIDGSEDDVIDEAEDEELDETDDNGSTDDDDDVAAEGDSDDSTPVATAVKAALAAAKTQKGDSMADSKKDMTKADHVRAEIDKRMKAGTTPIRPRDIIEALDKKGVKVTAPQVSVMLKKATGGSVRAKKAETATTEKSRAAGAVKRPMPKPAAPAPRTAKATKPGAKDGAAGLDKQSFDVLFEAAAFVQKCGSIHNAIGALSAYERLTELRD